MERGFNALRLQDRARAAPASARHGLDDHRAMFREEGMRFRQGHGAIDAADHRDPGGDRGGPRARFVAEQFQMCDIRSDEG